MRSAAAYRPGLSNVSSELAELASEPTRCVIVVDEALPIGRAANAAAVIALTLGKRHPNLAGPDLVDASAHTHPGLIPIGIAILAASVLDLGAVREKALKSSIDVVDFPCEGQQTNDCAEFGARLRDIPTQKLAYVGVGLYGSRKALGRIVGRFSANDRGEISGAARRATHFPAPNPAGYDRQCRRLSQTV